MPVRKSFWLAAGVLLGELRAQRGWTAAELAQRAGLSAELIGAYETEPDRYPDLEAWWRLTTALGVDLGIFLRTVETRSGVRLLHDVRLPHGGAGLVRGSAGGLAPREGTARPQAAAADDLSAFVDQLRDQRQDDASPPAS
jgi:transcriptional regulator with XRE-family HTH domain